MSTKVYSSRSDISISVLVDNKGVHVSFVPVSGGGSVFSTEDKKIQDAIEKHHNFGRLFKLREESVPEEKKEKKGKDKKVKDGEGGESGGESGDDGETGGEGGGKTVITVSCPEDAKDYLADKFGISRTAIKTVAAIKKAALEKNIEFSGI